MVSVMFSIIWCFAFSIKLYSTKLDPLHFTSYYVQLLAVKINLLMLSCGILSLHVGLLLFIYLFIFHVVYYSLLEIFSCILSLVRGWLAYL